MKFQQHKEDTRNPSPNSSQHPWQLNLQHAFTSLQNHCANFPNLQSSLSDGGARVSNSICNSSSSSSSKFWGRIGDDNRSQSASGKTDLMSTEDIEERLAGVPVYAVSNAEEEFVLVSGV